MAHLNTHTASRFTESASAAADDDNEATQVVCLRSWGHVAQKYIYIHIRKLDMLYATHAYIAYRLCSARKATYARRDCLYMRTFAPQRRLYICSMLFFGDAGGKHTHHTHTFVRGAARVATCGRIMFTIYICAIISHCTPHMYIVHSASHVVCVCVCVWYESNEAGWLRVDIFEYIFGLPGCTEVTLQDVCRVHFSCTSFGQCWCVIPPCVVGAEYDGGGFSRCVSKTIYIYVQKHTRIAR